MMEKRELKIDYTLYREELPRGYESLAAAARDAALRAYCPYSRFAVGAAVLLDNGEIITGCNQENAACNQENAAYPSGLCAERVALFAAASAYPAARVLALAIASRAENAPDEPVTPCGACRQVMAETAQRFGSDFDVLLLGATSAILTRASALLPFAFRLP